MIGRGGGNYHVEGHDILEGDLARAVALDQDLVDDLGAGAGGQTQHEGLGLGGLERLDAAWEGEEDVNLSRRYIKRPDGEGQIERRVHDLLTMYSAMYTEAC